MRLASRRQIAGFLDIKNPKWNVGFLNPLYSDQMQMHFSASECNFPFSRKCIPEPSIKQSCANKIENR